MADGHADPAAAAAMAGLLGAAADPSVATQRGTAVQTALLAATARTAAARGDRLAIAADRTHAMKWLTVLGLGFLTQVGLVLVHLEKPRAMAAALTVFSLAAIVAMGLVAAQELPFSGAIQVSPQLLATLPPGS